MDRLLEKVLTEKAVESIGTRYVENFEENKIWQKGELDENIGKMFENGKGLILFGEVGIGKTMDTVYLYREIVKHSIRNFDEMRGIIGTDENVLRRFIKGSINTVVHYYFMPKLFDILHSGGKIDFSRYIILDDLGREYVEPFSLSRFESLVEKWYRNSQILIITTNFTPNEFIERKSFGRITDRIREMCGIMKIKGKSRRHR